MRRAPGSTRARRTIDAEVAIIGGGPAGAAAARLLARWGHSVTLLTRVPPRPALAESLPPSAGKLLDRLGVRHALDAAGFVRSTGNTVHWGGGAPHAESFGGAEGPLGYQVVRDVLDRVMLAEAAAARATVRRRTAVDTVSAADAATGARIVRSAAGAGTPLRARWVLDCTGRAGLLAREWRVAEPGARTMALVGVWTREGGWALDDASHTIVESYGAGWAWSVPVTNTTRYVTVMVDPAHTRIAGAHRLAGVYHAELAHTAFLRAMVRGAAMASAPFARDASAYSARQVGDDGLLLVGDAASFVDPLSSFGIKKALASAWLASVVVHTALVQPGMTGAALALYAERERAMYESQRRRLAELSRDARGAHDTAFWHQRADVRDLDAPDEVDAATLRRDPDVLAAFAELRRRASIGLRRSSALVEAQRPFVRDNLVVMERHLLGPAFGTGVRYLRNIDLALLADLAPAHDQVPDLYDAYTRAAAVPTREASLPDFLGALAVLVGKGMLTFD